MTARGLGGVKEIQSVDQRKIACLHAKERKILTMEATNINRVLAMGLVLLLGFLLGVATRPALAQTLRGYQGYGNMMGGQGGMTQSPDDAEDFDCGDMRMGMMGRMGGGPVGMMEDVDRHFTEMMIPHHEDAVAMADLALQKATHPELKTLAVDIKRVQTAEIEQMRRWYKEWYGTDVPQNGNNSQGMMGMGMGMRMDLAYLSNSTAFDKTFIQMMIPHHNMAVMMSNMVLASGEHHELRELAREIIAGQSAEIRRMRAWYTQW